MQVRHTYTAAADPTNWKGRIVYKSGNTTVSLQNAGTQAPVGVVDRFEADGTTHRVSVIEFGEAWVVVGAGGFDADAAGVGQFIRGNDDAGGAALDGRAVAAAEGEFYVGRALADGNASAGGLMRCIVCPGQLAQAAT